MAAARVPGNGPGSGSGSGPGSGKDRDAGNGPGRDFGNGPDADDPYAGTREEMQRAIRRLDALEWVILFAAVGFALGGGALVAWILSTGTGLGFRSTWIVLSVLLLVIPGGIVLLKEQGRR